MTLDALVTHPSFLARIRRKAHSRLLQYATAASLALACSKADTFSVSAEDAQVPPDTQVQQCFDQDHDGFYAGVNSGVNCGTPLDCNDNDSTVFPGGLEICDRKDNNCNLETDEGVQVDLYEDNDKDSFGNPEKTKLGCYIPGMDPDIDEKKYVPNNDDCDDTDFMVNPAAVEVCDNIDNNCKDGIDEGLLSIFYADGDGDQFGDADNPTEACEAPLGYVSNSSDCDDENENTWQLVNVYTDADFDGYGALPVSLCIGAFVPPGYSLDNLDCDDSIMAVHPGALEICDLYDNDCDPATLDGSGEIPPLNTLQQGVCVNSLKSCLNGNWTDDYNGVMGYETVEASWQTTCDGLDNDCDGEIDPLSQAIFYFDGDNDGFGDSNNSVSGCSPLENYEALDGDCNDSNANINPEALEVCDGYNNDCNQATADGSDEQAPYNTLQAGVCADSYKSCINGSWQNNYISIPDYEVLETICDNLDNDCDGLTDETCPSCTPIAEICDGLDNDCDGTADNSLTTPSQPCSVGIGQCEGFGLEYKICQGQAGWSQQYFNCDAMEGEPSEEIADGIDNDCNGIIDDLESICGIIDDFNRPDGSLGENSLGNPWTNYTSNIWVIENQRAVAGGGLNPSASSEIGHRETFNFVVRFNLPEGATSGGIFNYGVNTEGCSYVGNENGIFVSFAVANNRSTQGISAPGGQIATGNQELLPNVDYLSRFEYNGTTYSLKLWEVGTSEPLEPLVTAIGPNFSGTYFTLTGNPGGNAGSQVDYIYEDCL